MLVSHRRDSYMYHNENSLFVRSNCSWRSTEKYIYLLWTVVFYIGHVFKLRQEVEPLDRETEDNTYTVDKQMNKLYSWGSFLFMQSCNWNMEIYWWNLISLLWLSHAMKEHGGIKENWSQMTRACRTFRWECSLQSLWVVLTAYLNHLATFWSLIFFSFCHGTFYCRCMNMFHGRDIVVLIMSWRILINLLSESLLFSFLIVV